MSRITFKAHHDPYRVKIGTTLSRRILHALTWLRHGHPSGENVRRRISTEWGNRTIFLAACVDRSEHSPLHDQITALLPDGIHRAHLYIGEDDGVEPTHYVVLHKDARGTWQLRNPRIHPVNDLVKPGVFFHVDRLDPSFDKCPTVTRIYGSGLAVVSDVLSMTEDYEMRRMLSHCYLLSDVLGSLIRGKLRVTTGTQNHRGIEPGTRFLFKAEALHNGWVDPLEFVQVQRSLYYTPKVQRMATTWVGLNGENLARHKFKRYVLPTIAGCPRLIADGTEYNAWLGCADLFDFGIAPFTILKRPSPEDPERQICELVVPGYLPSEARQVPFVAKTMSYLRKNIPSFTLVDDFLVPNRPMWYLLRDNLRRVSPARYGAKERSQGVKMVLLSCKPQGYYFSGPDDVIHMFERADVLLTAEHKDVLYHQVAW